MVINASDFIKISSFFHRMKILHGNDFVNATLRKHPDLKNALLEYEKKHILELERDFNLGGK